VGVIGRCVVSRGMLWKRDASPVKGVVLTVKQKGAPFSERERRSE